MPQVWCICSSDNNTHKINEKACNFNVECGDLAIFGWYKRDFDRRRDTVKVYGDFLPTLPSSPSPILLLSAHRD